jgi:hypothetical protein
MHGVYRNLNAKKQNNGTDLWSVVNAHRSTDGWLVKETGVTHSVNFSLTDVIINNPVSIGKGVDRITKRGQREVCAVVGGTIGDTKPTSEYVGRLTLDLKLRSFALITDLTKDGQTRSLEFNPSGFNLWFGSDGCEVYV